MRKARTFIASKGLKKGDRCGLLAANSIRWVAMDLALMAEGLIVVPLYSRQAPAELVAMMKDCTPSLVCCGDAALRDAIAQNWAEAPPQFLFDEIFAGVDGVQLDRPQVANDNPVTIIYTSGTSGEAKGVVLTAANVGFMLERTAERLEQLMSGSSSHVRGQDRIFHYLPFTFAASWIALLTFLKRRSLVTINMDLTKIANDMRAVAPDYFLNVPQLLERMRRAVDEQLWQTGGVAQAIYSRAKGAWARRQEEQAEAGRRDVAGAGECAGVSGDPEEDDREESEGADLRVGAAECGDAALFHDAGNSRAAGLRADGDDGDLHDGRSEPG